MRIHSPLEPHLMNLSLRILVFGGTYPKSPNPHTESTAAFISASKFANLQPECGTPYTVVADDGSSLHPHRRPSNSHMFRLFFYRQRSAYNTGPALSAEPTSRLYNAPHRNPPLPRTPMRQNVRGCPGRLVRQDRKLPGRLRGCSHVSKPRIILRVRTPLISSKSAR